MRWLLAFVFSMAAIAAENAPEPIAISDLKRDKRVDFAAEIVPLFQKNCLACHNAKDAKGDLVLETPTTILKGGETGPAVAPGKAEESLLLKVASHQTKPFMPPKNNKADAKPFGSDELGLIKLWINQGATGVVAMLPPLRWQELPPAFNPILAAAITPDGQFAACSRGNHVDLYELPTMRFVASLVDAAVGAADRDVVESLAFSPNGEILAAGGYRNIKLWRRQPGASKNVAIAELGAARLADFSTDGKLLAIVTTNEQVRVINVADGKVAREFAAETNHFRAIAVSASSIALAFDNQIQVRNGSDTNVTLINTPAEIRAMKFHSDGRLMEAGADNIIRVWKGTNKSRELPFAAASLAISTDGKRIAAADGSVVRLINFEDGKVIAEVKGDRRDQESAARAQRDVDFAKTETAFRKANAESAEKQQKTEAEALKKVSDAKAGAEKTLGEKNDALKKADERKAAAQKAVNETATALAQANENKTLSVKLVEAAEAQVKGSVASAAEAAQIFERAKLNRSAAYEDVINLAAAAKAAPEKTPEAHAAIDRAVVVKLSFEHAEKAKNAADKAAADAGVNAKLAIENKAKAEKTATDLAAKQKDVEAKLKDSEKQFVDADAAVKQATSVLKNIDTNLQGTTAVAKKADENVAEAKRLFASADTAEKAAVGALEAANKRASGSERAVSRITIAGPWLVCFDDKALRFYSESSGRPGPVLDRTGALHAIGASENELLVSDANGITAISLLSEWKLERQIGDGSDNSPLADRVLALDFSADGKMLASGGGVPSRAGELKLWNAADGTLVREIRDAHSDTVFSVRFSPDQTALASGGADKLMKVFDVASGKFVRSFEGHTHHVINVSWERNGRTLASAGADSAVKIWDFASGEQKKTITGASREITAFQFLDSSTEALVVSGDNQIRLVRDDGSNVRNFAGASDYTQSAAITPDGRWIVAGGSDSQFRVWSGAKSEALAVFGPPLRNTGGASTALAR